MNKNFIKTKGVADYEYVMSPKMVLHSSLSDSAKVLYMLMIERLGLSLKNSWADEKDNVYIIYTLAEVMQSVSCSKSKALKILAELDNGYIKRKHQGQGKPDLIFLVDIFAGKASAKKEKCANKTDTQNEDLQKTNSMECKDDTSGCTKNNPPEVCKTDSNNNKYKNNKINNNNHILSFKESAEEMEDYKNCIKLIIDYDALCEGRDKGILDEIVNAMTSAVCSKREYIRIGGEDIPKESVKKRLLSLDQFHIEYVYDCLCEAESNVKNMRAYLLTSLYRAPDTINLYYKIKVKRDLKGYKLQ